ncbi:hypothetical protein LSAT2_029732 [Lamellibrachia satsuma]|nr:hypothetical protein LSAT2_029732 [Lamellibrachia satsuma]
MTVKADRNQLGWLSWRVAENTTRDDINGKRPQAGSNERSFTCSATYVHNLFHALTSHTCLATNTWWKVRKQRSVSSTGKDVTSTTTTTTTRIRFHP